MKNDLRRLGVAVAAGLVMAVLVAACGSSGGGSGSSESTTAGGQGLTKVSLAYAPVSQAEAMWLGNKKGFFADNGIELELTLTNNPSQLPLALNSGQFDVVQTTWGSIGISHAQGLPIVGIAPNDYTGTEESADDAPIIALKSSGIESLKELEGKSVAVNSIESLASFEVEKALENAGIEPSSVTLVPIPFPSQLAAVKSGRVNAASTLEPFYAILNLEQGANVLAGASIAIGKNIPQQGWAADEDWVESNPEVVKEFQKAIIQSNEYALAHMDEMRKSLPEFSEGITPEVAETMRMPRWVTSVDEKGLQKLLDEQFEAGIMSKELKAEEVNRFGSTSGSGA